MKTTTTILTMTLAVTLVALAAAPADADPLPGQVLKFQQVPMVATQIDGTVFNGHDELSTAYFSVGTTTGFINYSGTAMADDFADKFSTPVVHVRWWGSYLKNFINPDQRVDKFLIAFESDEPADPLIPGDFSHPKEVILSQIVDLDVDGVLDPGEGTYLETQITAALPENIFEYNAELHLGKEFPQDPDTVYWLKIVALIDAFPLADQDLNTQWGWHNRDYTIMDPLAGTPALGPGEHDQRPIVDPAFPTEVWHFQDDSVSSTVEILVDTFNMPNMPTNVIQDNYTPQNYVDLLDGPGPGVNANGIGFGGIGLFSKDLAFELFTTAAIPEPSSVVLMVLGLATFFGFRRRRSTTS